MKILEVYKNVYLIEKKSENTAQELKDTFPGREICVCDFYVSGSEDGEAAAGGALRFEGLLIVDHHAPRPEMMRHVSSTTFASQYVAECGPLDGAWAVVINHPDTDSILSALIMSGVLEPRDEYNAAAIAADHTGAENVIADLLQSLEEDGSLQKSVETLQKCVDVLRKVVEQRLRVRQELKALADARLFKMEGGIAYKMLDKKIDAGLLPSLFPEAEAVMVAWPMRPGSKGKWAIKVRLGLEAAGIALNEMGLPDAGGRWNAISTTRHGGTNVEPEAYVKMVRAKIDQAKQGRSGR